MLSSFLERYPQYGILASFSGFVTTLLGFIHVVSPVVEFAAACFGLAAGIYTFKIKRHHWHREKTKTSRNP